MIFYFKKNSSIVQKLDETPVKIKDLSVILIFFPIIPAYPLAGKADVMAIWVKFD